MIRDTLHLLIAQVIVLACNYAIHAGLGRMLGPVEYGLFGVAMAMVSMAEMVLVRGVRDTVSRYSAQQPERAPAIKRQALRVQTVFSGALWLFFVLAIPSFTRWMGAPRLARPLLITSLIVPLISIFSVYLGDLSGRGLFRRRALAMNLQSFSKAVLALSLAMLGFGIEGALVGYVISYILATLGAMSLSHDPRPAGPSFPVSRVVRFAVPIIAYSALMAVLGQIDLTLVKSMLPEPKAAGYYTAAKMLSRPAGQIFSVFTFTLLPAISRCLAQGGDELAGLLRRSIRFLWLLQAPLAFVGWAASDSLVTILYSSRYAPAAAPFRWLLAAATLNTLYSTLTTVIIGSGRMGVPLISAAALIGVQVSLAVWLIPRLGMNGAALAVLASSLLGAWLIGVYVRRRMVAYADWPSLARIALASASAGAVVRIWPFGGPAVLPGIVLGLLLYVLLLRWMGEVSPGELRAGWRFLADLLPRRSRRLGN